MKKTSRLVDMIKNQETALAKKTATAGFDGFIDTIVKIIKSKQVKKSPSLFKKIKEFGNYILEKEGTSLSLELQEQSIKIGGNMPIMSNALGRLGISVNCVGSLGYPQAHPVFKNLSPNCHIHSFADPGTSTAFEFNDGKIMVAQMESLNTIGWDKIKNIIGIDELVRIYKESDLLCLVNWSEIDASSDIWKGLLKDVLPRYTRTTEKQIVFFDLSDCSKRSSDSVMEALNLLNKFGQYAHVILGLNKNEARLIYRTLFNKDKTADLAYLGEKIFGKLEIETLLLHCSTEAMAFNKETHCSSKSFFTKNPKISTGAGDNFNAGFCAAQLLKLDLKSSIIFANAVAGFYVNEGMSPKLQEVIQFLEKAEKLKR